MKLRVTFVSKIRKWGIVAKSIDIIRLKTLRLAEYNPAVWTLVFNLRKAKKHTKTHHCFELFLPRAARCSEPVNSRCGCVWQGRRVGSASKVKKSRKILALLLCQLNKIHLVQWFFNKWSVYSANMKQQLRCNEVLAMLTWSKAHLLFFMRLNALH